MATKDWQTYFSQPSVHHWVRSGLLATMLLGNAVAAIAAPTEFSDDELSPLPKEVPFPEPRTRDHYHSNHGEITRPATSSTTTEPATSPEGHQPEMSLTDATETVRSEKQGTSGFGPDPDYTAPLPPLGPGADALPPVPSSPATPNPFVNEMLGSPTSNFDSYRLGPGDSFFVNVRQFPELSFQATLDIQGNVIVPLQGVVSFRGLTLSETEALIARIYNQYVVNPDVSITLVAQRGVEVTILGEVVRPGFYPLGAPQIAAALLSAGGTTGEADLRNVVIQRQLPDGQTLERVIDLFTPLKEGQEIPDVALQDGDVILVDRLNPAELDEYDRELVSRSTLAEPIITVRFLNYGSGSLGGATSGALTAIDLPNGSRFSDALVRANLNPDTSNLGEVALIRFNEESGQAVATTIDGNEAFRGLPSENPPLQDNDVIIVNRTLLAKITYALNTFTQPFRDVLGFLLFFDQLADSADNLFGP